MDVFNFQFKTLIWNIQVVHTKLDIRFFESYQKSSSIFDISLFTLSWSDTSLRKIAKLLYDYPVSRLGLKKW